MNILSKVYLLVDLSPEQDFDGDAKSESLHHLPREELDGSGRCALGEHHKCITLLSSCIKIKRYILSGCFVLRGDILL